MKKFILLALISSSAILSSAKAESKADYKGNLTCKSIQADYSGTNYDVQILQSDINGDRTAQISWIHGTKIYHTQTFSFASHLDSPKATVEKFTFTDGAGESQLAIFKTPYSWLGKTYYSANLSGPLFNKGINLSCAK